MDLFVAHARILAEALEGADSRRAFRSAVQQFEHLLARVSDYPSDFLSDSDAQSLSSIADAVVGRIEQRLDAHTDRAAVQRELSRRIDQVRVDVAAIYMVLRHLPNTTTAASGMMQV